jgi:ABC-type hemin transport system ATPase subunit
VRLQPLSVFVGANGSGKTNLIRAIELLGDILFAGTTEPVLEQGWESLAYRHARTSSTMDLEGTVRIPFVYDAETEDTVSTLGVEVSIGLAHLREADDVIVRHESIRLLRRVGQARSELTITADRQGRIRVDPGSDPDLWRIALSGAFLRVRSQQISAAVVRDTFQSFYETPAKGSTSTQDGGDGRSVLLLPRLLAGTEWFERIAIALFRVQRIRVESGALRGTYSSLAGFARGELGGTGEGLADAVDRLRRDGRFGPVMAAMREVIPRLENVEAVRTQPGRKGLVFRETDVTGDLPDFAVSDGTIHTLALLVALESRPRAGLRRPRILALEEPENAIHPWAQAVILRRAQELTAAGTRQVVVTTHSAVLLDTIRPESLYIVEHDGITSTATPAQKIRHDLEERLKRTGMTLGESWQHGLLGGTPQLAS